MTTNLSVLTQFKEYIKAANADKKGFYENLERNFNLKTKAQFEALVTEQLTIASQGGEIEVLTNLLEKTIKPCLIEKQLNTQNELYAKIKKDLKEELDRLDKELVNNHANSDTKKIQLANLQKFFRLLLEAKNKEMIVDELWEAYYSSQTNGSYLSNVATDFGKRTEDAFRTSYAQTQADPLKRVGMILFEALFTFFDYALYKSTNGKERLSTEYEFKQNNGESSWDVSNQAKLGRKGTPGVGEGNATPAPKLNPNS